MTYRAVNLNKGRMWPSLPLPNQPSALSVIKQSRDLVSLDSMWHTSTRRFRSEKNSLISVWVRVARLCFERSTWNVLPRVTKNWGLNTLRLNLFSKLFHRTTCQWTCSFLWRNSQLAPPMRAIMRNLAGCTRSKPLNFIWSQKSKSRPILQRIRLSVTENTRCIETVAFWPFLAVVTTKLHSTAHWQGRHDAVMNRTNAGQFYV